MTLEERFWSKVNNAGANGCWEWAGARDPGGYGRLFVRGEGNGLAHRVSWELANGPAEGRCVLHKCDNPPCINPDHLFLGSQAENNADRDAKGRTVVVFGEDHGNHRLAEVQVKEIRERLSRGEPRRSIASAFGIHRNTVAQIAAGRTWAHVR